MEWDIAKWYLGSFGGLILLGLIICLSFLHVSNDKPVELIHYEEHRDQIVKLAEVTPQNNSNIDGTDTSVVNISEYTEHPFLIAVIVIGSLMIITWPRDNYD